MPSAVAVAGKSKTNDDKKKKKKKKEEVKIPKDLAEQIEASYLQLAIKLFDASDKEEEGVVDIRQLDFMLRVLGGNPTETELDEWKATFRNAENKMDLISFLKCVALEQKTHKTNEDIAVAFKAFDPDDSGFIRDAALRDYLTKTCEPLPPSLVNLLFDEANNNRNADGDINYGDFIDKMTTEAQKAWTKKATKMGLITSAKKTGKKSGKKSGKKKK